MKYRELDANGDYTFGRSMAEFLNNSPAAVAQAVMTRLKLAQGEWFLDQTDGTPYSTQILGTGTQTLYDKAIRERILDTPGVQSIDDYASTLDQERNLRVAVLISTVYGQAAVVSSL
jgi:hypothetical protein